MFTPLQQPYLRRAVHRLASFLQRLLSLPVSRRSAVVPPVPPGRTVGGDPHRNGFGVTEITRLFARDPDDAEGIRHAVRPEVIPENWRERACDR
jgi:hypothetical protein